MAKIPIYNDLQVAPGNVQQVEYGRQGNLFAGLGQGLQQAGAGLEQVAAIQERERKEAAHTKYLEASNLRAADIQNLKREFGQKAGKDAFSSVGDYEKKVQEINDKYAGMVADDEDASEKYRLTAIPTFADANGFLSTHAFQEKNKFDDGMDKVALDNNNNLYRENFHHQGKLGQDIYNEMSNDVIRRSIERKMGKGPETDEAVKTAIRANKSGNDLAIVQHLAGSNKTSAARSYFDAAKDGMMESDRAAGEKLLADVTDFDTAREMAAEDLSKADQVKLKQGNTEELYALRRDAINKKLTPQQMNSYLSHINNAITAAEQIYTERTTAQGKALTDAFVKATSLEEQDNIRKQAMAEGVDPAIVDGAYAMSQNHDRPTEPAVMDAAITAINKAKTEGDLMGLAKMQADMIKQRQLYGNKDYALITGLVEQRIKELKPNGLTGDARSTFKSAVLSDMKARGIAENSEEYKIVLDEALQYSEDLKRKPEDLEVIKAKEFTNTALANKKLSRTTVQSGDRFFAAGVVDIPTIQLARFIDRPESLPSAIKFSGVNINTLDDVDQVDRVVKSLLVNPTPQNRLKTRVWMNTLGDPDDARAALDSAGIRNPSDMQLSGYMIQMKKADILRAEQERQKRQSAPSIAPPFGMIPGLR